MPDAPDSDSPHDSSSSRSTPNWYVQQWEALCEELGTSDPNEVLARVQTLKRQIEHREGDDRSDEGLITISEVEEVFRDLNAKIAKLRERNAALADQLADQEEADDHFGTLHQQTEDLLDRLGATTMEEAHARVERMEERIEELYQEKEQLVQAGLSDAEEATSELDRLRTERDQLREERDALEAERDDLHAELDEASSDDSSSSASPGPDTSVLEAAVVIRDEVGISSPEQAEALVHVVDNLYDRIRDRAEAYGLTSDDSPTSVIGRLRTISSHLESFPDPSALPDQAAELLGVSTTAEIPILLDLGVRVVERHEEALDVTDIDLSSETLRTLLETIEGELDVAPSSPDADDTLPAEVGEILDVETVEDARDLAALIDEMSDQLDELRAERTALDEAGLTPERALSMIDNMEAQLQSLYHASEEASAAAPHSATAPLDETLQQRIDALLDTAPAAADDLSTVVHHLVDRLETLSEEHAVLDDAGFDAAEAVTLIESMEAQLNDLYERADERTDDSEAARRLDAIDDVLGISSREEAEELADIAHQMEEQLTSLYEEKEKLQALGLSSIDDAVDMIESMENQLDELYENQEARRNVQTDATGEQSTFQQLEELYAEREKLEEALGVSSADEVIEMVESLNTQLDDLYTGRDAELDPEERHDAQLWSPDAPDEPADAADAEAVDASEEPAASDQVDPLTLTSMEQQLETLYREKALLLKQGFGGAEEAVSRLQTQQRQIDVLQRENRTYQQRFHRLRSELGTEHVPRIVELVHTLESAADTSIDELDLDVESAPTEYGVHIEAAPPLVPADTLTRLDDMSPEDLEALDVGVMRLQDDGTVAALNEQALQLPGLPSEAAPDSLVGKNFFSDLAPSTNNNLFFGRFQKGRQHGEMDARFPYTFTSSEDESMPFVVHLYRAPNSPDTWLLFAPA